MNSKSGQKTYTIVSEEIVLLGRKSDSIIGTISYWRWFYKVLALIAEYSVQSVETDRT